jgi:hypothetical protein
MQLITELQIHDKQPHPSQQLRDNVIEAYLKMLLNIKKAIKNLNQF